MRPPPPSDHAPNPAQQHDLAEGPARRLVAEAGVAAGERVVEVGPGLGVITAALLGVGARVVAIERDPTRVATLRTRFATEVADGHLTLMAGDALRVRPPVASPFRVVANPPFNLTAALVRWWLLDSHPAPVALDLVLQREAALKLTGGEGNHTRSSIIARLCGVPHLTRTLPRDVVSPPSRVDLAVWRHRRQAQAPAPDELAAVDRLLDHAFAGPRTMQEALRGLATGVQIRRQAAEQGWDPRAHPRTVPPAAWCALARLLVACGRLGQADVRTRRR
jgi:16S rRNA (adenine1518-N6/adenine1519-N6)-dimethyltransferase